MTHPDLLDLAPAPSDLASEACAGLGGTPKTLPSKFLYDKRGSELFERICGLPEYYPTRTEFGILRAHLPEMARALGPRVELIELGSGAGTKTRLVLEALDEPVAYVPIEISREFLLESARELAARFPGLAVLPVCADFLQPFEVPEGEHAAERRVVFIPGSTIGNFEGDAARRLLRWMAELAGPGGGLLIGADLRKDEARLVAAYDDAQGVTAEFNLNILARLNREAGADFDLARFEHRAVWNRAQGRMEMHLASRGAQTVHLGGEDFAFAGGETIRTEVSHKYGPGELAQLAERFELRRIWMDHEQLFSVQYLEVR